MGAPGSRCSSKRTADLAGLDEEGEGTLRSEKARRAGESPGLSQCKPPLMTASHESRQIPLRSE